MTSHVEAAVQARIQAARRRNEDMRRQRAELAAARRRGLAARHAQKLANLRGAEDHADVAQAPTTDPSRGDTPTVADRTVTETDTVDSARATDTTQ
jgi:hypothetical protein